MAETNSTIVTPPDFVDSGSPSVTLIDPDWSDVEDVAFYLKTSKKTYNVYVYRSEMGEVEWLDTAIAKSGHIIVNTINTESSSFKDKLAVKSNSYYYGPKNFLMNKNKIEKPIEYFLNLE
jgi:dipeptidyl aminopeptidase/acylaminoacyl peptidase